MSPARRSISLTEGQSSTFKFTVDEGNPRSNLTITGPLQPTSRVSISFDGMVNINMVGMNHAGTHIATWRNGIGEAATFTLNLSVTRKLMYSMFLHENHSVETGDLGTSKLIFHFSHGISQDYVVCTTCLSSDHVSCK